MHKRIIAVILALICLVARAEGGSRNPGVDECAGEHWQGFTGMKQEAVDQIAKQMQTPPC
jgi:hypothetical protein